MNKDSVQLQHSEQAWPTNDYPDPRLQYSTTQSLPYPDPRLQYGTTQSLPYPDPRLQYNTTQSSPYQPITYSNPSSDWTPIQLKNNNIVKDKETTRYSENLGNSLINKYEGVRTQDYTDQYYEYNDYDEYNLSGNDSEVYDTSKLLTGKTIMCSP